LVTVATEQLSAVTGVPKTTLVDVHPTLVVPVLADGAVIVGLILSKTVTVYEQLAKLPAASSTRYVTVVNPKLNVLVPKLLMPVAVEFATVEPVNAQVNLVTEQLSAMEMMAVDPIARVVAPRFWAGVISMPLLAAMFSAMGVFGGYVVGVVLIGVDEGSFWSQMQSAVDVREDIINGVIKSVVFGIAITWIALFEGYDAPPTAEGVSGATTRTVVTSSLAVLALDFILTSFMFSAA